MPKKVASAERALKRQAKRKGFTGKRAGAYVFGTLHRLFPEWKPNRKGK